MWQNETQQTRKYQSRQNMSLETRNRFAQLQNTQDKEAKNYKKKRNITTSSSNNCICKAKSSSLPLWATKNSTKK